MGLYNFKPQFVPFILDGRKTHTIRAARIHRQKLGGIMHLYTGLRQRGAKLLMRAECTEIQLIAILENGAVIVDGARLDAGERDALAISDGFENFERMLDFWNGRLPFSGEILHWARPDSAHSQMETTNARGSFSRRTDRTKDHQRGQPCRSAAPA
jgi:5-keto 4-deoxyuronate isomerase